MSQESPFPSNPSGSEPPGSPPPAVEPAVHPQLSPQQAILNAALTNLEYARQYLDKFLNWSDYVIASYYHAFALALRTSPEERENAQADLKNVASWLARDDRKVEVTAAWTRIRAEAIYNAAVLLAAKGEIKEARAEFESVLRLLDQDREHSPKGVRLAAQFGLLLLLAEEIRTGMVEDSAPRAKWSGSKEAFLAEVQKARSVLQRNSDTAEKEAQSLVLRLKEAAKKHEIRHDLERPLRDEQAVITKATKDDSILREMEEQLRQLENGLFDEPSEAKTPKNS